MVPTDIVRSFRRLRAVVIGDAMLDSYLEGNAARLCTEGPVPVVRRTAEERVPGGAANTAANLRALGAQVIFLGIVGPDLYGAFLKEALGERGIDGRWLIEQPDAGTLHKMRVLANDQYVVRFDAGEIPSSTEIERTLIARLNDVIPAADVVVISDYRYGVVTDALLERLEVLRKRYPVPLVVDSKDLPRFARTSPTVITPNHLEARLFAGGSSGDDGPVTVEEAHELGTRLLGIVAAQWAAVTMAERGVAMTGRDGERAHLATHPVVPASDVGAGDSFSAALALALGAGAEPIDAARIGISAAGIAVARRRTAVVQHQELLQRVSVEDGVLRPSLAMVAARLDRERRKGKTIVFTNGVFDLLHAGHVHFLRGAKSLGDVLVVGINSDDGARRLKGSTRPVMSERERLALVAALDPVDHVVVFEEDTPADTIRALRPHIHVKGGDYAGEDLPEADAVREVGGRIEILPLAGDVSTSEVIDRIVTLAGKREAGA
ncbi:MAG TPA: D-glycero-beta-D-manno-heptose 1-phosphate adenylyltransferase [Chloroflexota bacterium]|nr:D-glycero-beta-D-manno-heptose 1-phosphate adenylyltransferase [Chloroflexota bacterium]